MSAVRNGCAGQLRRAADPDSVGLFSFEESLSQFASKPVHSRPSDYGMRGILLIRDSSSLSHKLSKSGMGSFLLIHASRDMHYAHRRIPPIHGTVFDDYCRRHLHTYQSSRRIRRQSIDFKD
jgi:hypothetical protein